MNSIPEMMMNLGEKWFGKREEMGNNNRPVRKSRNMEGVIMEKGMDVEFAQKNFFIENIRKSGRIPWSGVEKPCVYRGFMSSSWWNPTRDFHSRGSHLGIHHVLGQRHNRDRKSVV